MIGYTFAVKRGCIVLYPAVKRGCIFFGNVKNYVILRNVLIR